MENQNISIEDMANFCKRKGFVYPSAEIYGGFSGFWDYGPLGVELKNNLKKFWWKFHVHNREDIVGVDGSIITNPKVWKASGHVDNFSDILVFCPKCKKTDKIDKHEIKKVKCDCEGEFDWEKSKEIKQMLETNVGLKGSAYLRPETAQSIFINFKSVYDNSRGKLPFGIAQIGKAFRNEIAPRDFLFRCREFEQMEIEYFVDPKEKFPYELGDNKISIFSEDMQKNNKETTEISFKEAFNKKILKTKWHAYWLEKEYLWFISLGANPENLRIRQHVSKEKSHYALDTWDIEYKFPFGWKEVHGMANRSNYDLNQHQKNSQKKLKVINLNNEKILPTVYEPSQGVERALLVFLFDAYTYDEKRKNIVLKLHPQLAPIKTAILPLVKNNSKIIKISKDIFNELKKDFNIVYDESGSIGRRYSRNDEIGTPFCVTIDEDSIKNKDVTIRNRDTTKQKRIKISELKNILTSLIKKEINFDKIK